MSNALLDMFRGNIMVMDEVMARFAERAPVPVMARLAIQRALDQNWIDTVFEQYRQSQYTRELLFSTIMEIMSVVAMGLRPSLHAAAKAYVNLPVSITALYDKINHADLGVMRALIQGSQDRLSPVLDAMQPTPAATVARLPPAHRRRQPFAGEREAAQAAAPVPQRGLAGTFAGGV